MSQAPPVAGRPPSPDLVPALLVAAVLAAIGFGVLALVAPRLALLPTVLAEDSRYCLPVDALAVARHDFAFGDDHHVMLGRFLEGDLKAVWQTNYFLQSVTPSGAFDLQGDGGEELCLFSGDSTGAAAWGLGPDGTERVRLGPIRDVSERPGFPWDGKLSIEGILPRGRQRGVVCRLMAGFARRPRGVALYDAATHQREWTYEMGTFPQRVQVADVDGDGNSQLLVTTSSPDNGASRNGTDDSHCYAMAIDPDGALRWQVVLGGSFATSAATVLAPTPAYATPRVVATFDSRRARQPEPGRVFLIDGRTGRVIDHHQFQHGIGAPQPLGEGDQFVAGSSNGCLRVFERGLMVGRQRDLGAPVEAWGCADVDGDGEPEIVASTPNELLLLERDLDVRGRLELRPGTVPVIVHLASAGVGHVRLAVDDGRALVVDIEPRPWLGDPLAVGGVLGLAVLGGGAVPLVRRVRRARPRPAGAAAREFLLDYHQIRHETFQSERPFARLRLWAQARAAGHPLPGEALESACDDFERIGLPTLMRFADRARAMKVDRPRVRRIRSHANTVAAALRQARLADEQRSAAAVGTALAAIDALAQECYEVYWEVVMRAPCRANQAAAEAMMAKTALLEQGRILTRYEADGAAREPVLFDRDELRALLGELVENAARSLAGAPDAELQVSIKEHPGDPRRIIVSVRDNGAGMAPGLREKLFTPEAATREGGGFGLYHAREVARRWLADLSVEDPPTGHGLVVRIVVRACRIVDRRASDPPQKGTSA